MAQTQTFIYDNLTFDCQGIDPDGNRNQGIASFVTSAYGNMLSTFITADVGTFNLTPLGDIQTGIVIAGTAGVITMSAHFDDLFIEKLKDSWIKWSQIGYADFTIGRDNVAGTMPMDWDGTVYDIRKLDKQVMVYGANGVSILTPAGNAFGLNTIYTVGLMSKNSVCGTDHIHYFIDKLGQLWEMSERLQKLDYSEYLSVLSFPVMSWDNEKNLIYICDGSYGFVYSPDSSSLGRGPINITGIRYKDGTSYVTSPDWIDIPYFELTTDIYDFGTRKDKTVFGFEVSTNLLGNLQASIEFRADYKSNFRDVGWHPVTPAGKVYLPCYGVEFRFKLRSLKYEYFEIDWIKINGVIHGFSHLDIEGRVSAN